MNRIFVYGTLKSNEPNHHLMQEYGAEFISEGMTVKQWPLVIDTVRNVPFLLGTNKVGKKILGEIYDVNAETLAFLDEFEGVHLNLYSSIEIEVQNLSTSLPELLRTYVLDNFNENYFLNEATILFERYTENNGHFGAYTKRSKEFDLETYLKKIKNIKN